MSSGTPRSSPSATAPLVHVACLCAAWCRLCDEYTVVLTAATEAVGGPGARMVVRWIDIEDEADLVGDFDVETFPTIVIVVQGQVRFAGPVHPHADTLIRLLRAAALETRAETQSSSFPVEVLAFAERLARRESHGGV